jgi:hypothetical protein
MFFEEYRNCGCVSGLAKSKKDLLGYCKNHGSERTRIYDQRKMFAEYAHLRGIKNASFENQAMADILED